MGASPTNKRPSAPWRVTVSVHVAHPHPAPLVGHHLNRLFTAFPPVEPSHRATRPHHRARLHSLTFEQRIVHHFVVTPHRAFPTFTTPPTHLHVAPFHDELGHPLVGTTFTRCCVAFATVVILRTLTEKVSAVAGLRSSLSHDENAATPSHRRDVRPLHDVWRTS
jgi:hypothetical protein